MPTIRGHSTCGVVCTTDPFARLSTPEYRHFISILYKHSTPPRRRGPDWEVVYPNKPRDGVREKGKKYGLYSTPACCRQLHKWLSMACKTSKHMFWTASYFHGVARRRALHLSFMPSSSLTPALTASFTLAVSPQVPETQHDCPHYIPPAHCHPRLCGGLR